MKIRNYLALAAIIAAALPFVNLPAAARGFSGIDLDKIGEAFGVSQATAAPLEAGARAEVAFSPDGGAEALVLRTIGTAKQSLRLAAYSFTSAEVVRALLGAKRRGVDVAVLVDQKNNLSEGRSGKARAALSALANAAIPVRTISRYAIHHDKFIVVDEQHIETGSFNYSSSAAKRNSENVLVLWNSPAIAAAYLRHWQSRWDQGAVYEPNY